MYIYVYILYIHTYICIYTLRTSMGSCVCLYMCACVCEHTRIYTIIDIYIYVKEESIANIDGFGLVCVCMWV